MFIPTLVDEYIEHIVDLAMRVGLVVDVLRMEYQSCNKPGVL